MDTQNAIDVFIKETGSQVAAELEACTRCGMCAEACHFYQATGVPEYAPVWKFELLRKAHEQRFTLGGKIKLALGIDKPVNEEDLKEWSSYVYHACTVCNRCALVCPMGIDIGHLIAGVRTGLSAAGFVPKDLEDSVQKQIDEGSPLGVTDEVYGQRIDFVDDEWEVDIPVDKEGADTLVIFSSIEIMKFPQDLAAITKILNAAGENWTVSTKAREVVNFGFFDGNPEHKKLILKRVLDGAKEMGVKKIVVTECGHAYDALRWSSYNLVDVPKDLEITHIVGLIGEYLESGRIKLKEKAFNEGTITFHDACKIQRTGGHIKEPRMVMDILAPDSFKEMTPNKEQNFCCGGGGGVIVIKDADPLRYAAFELKMDQIKEVGADTVVMACANCRLQFVDCVGHFNLDLKVAGLSQMVADALEV
jgi:Fe-S oxidoreductase